MILILGLAFIVLAIAGIWYAVHMEQSQNGGITISPKDVFLQLLAIITLYASAISFTILVFQYINLAFPDQVRDAYYYGEGIRDSIRAAVSTLIVVFPAYLVTNRLLNKQYAAEPERRRIGIRKWLIYLTLFVAALIGIVDLATLVYTLLGGDFTVRFILKVATILFVTGSIFGYYFTDIRKNKID